MDPLTALQLLDWKRRITSAYLRAQAHHDPVQAWHEYRRERDQMFRTHPQSPLPSDAIESFAGLAYYDYAPSLRITARIEQLPPERVEIAGSDGVPYAFTRFGKTTFALEGMEASLELYWLDGYGGGLFLPFRDETSGSETYGSGRYLLDTVKGADLGESDGELILDFNFAYQPSCSYDPKWSCPLAPPANRLPFPVRAGERLAGGR